MYRARVQAISGTKILAGGKWLQCIGNKNFRIGELVWTDGRCVYGNNQIPQQPPVITHPGEETIIPILSGNQLYCFSKGKLKPIAELEKKYDIMFNDRKGQVFVYDEETNAKISGDEKESLVAANIDRAGNIYLLTKLREREAPYSKYYDIIRGHRLLKNGKEIQRFVIDDFVQNQLAEVADPPKGPLPPSFSADVDNYTQIGVGGFYSPFIENENNWYLFFDLDTTKGWKPNDLDANINSIITFNYAPKGKPTFLAKGYMQKHMYEHTPEVFWRSEGTYNSAKVFLHDGFYYELIPHPIYKWYETGIHNTLFRQSFFSPVGKKIFEILSRQNEKQSLITSVKGGYLFSTGGFFLNNYSANDFHEGLYFFHNNSFEPLLDLTHVLHGSIANTVLRQMEKTNNWYKKNIEINLNEIA